MTTRFDTIELEQVAKDRVRMHGIQGEPPPPTLKVCINRAGGFRNDMNVCLTGLDIEAKAALVEEAFWKACPFEPGDFASVTTRLMRTDKPDPETNEQAVAILKISAKDPDEKKVGRAFSNAVIELALASIPGFFGVGGGPGAGRPFGVYEPACVPAEVVPQEVVVLGGETREVSSVIPSPAWSASSRHAGPDGRRAGGPRPGAPLGSRLRRALRRQGRQRQPRRLRPQRRGLGLARRLPERRAAARAASRGGGAARRPLPAPGNIRSLNFVIHGLLEEGVAASTRQDAQAKSLGEWLRARVVDLPEALLP